MTSFQKYIDGQGFKSAQIYYSTLKQKFLQNCLHKTEDMQLEQLSEIITKFENQLYNRYSEFQKVKRDMDFLDQTINAAMVTIDGILSEENSQETLNQIKLLKQKYQDEENKNEEEIKILYKEIIDKIKEILLNEQDIISSVQVYIKQKTNNITLTAIENEYVGYIARKILQKKILVEKIFSLNQAAIAGYYQEATETEAMQELLKHFGSIAIHGGTSISQKTKTETPLDVIIGSKYSGKKRLESSALSQYDKMLDIIDDLKININTAQDFFVDWQPILEKAKINTVGIQSKLYSINFSNPRPQGYGIGNRKTIKQDFTEYYKKQKDMILTQALSAKFFNESQTAIIEAFGPTTLLFRTGSQRFFIDELIKEISKNNFMFAFNMIKERKLTNYVIITNEVSNIEIKEFEQ